VNVDVFRGLPRPSSLPMVAQCSSFEAGGGAFADEGVERHKYFAALGRANVTEVEARAEQLPEDDQDGVNWAFNYVNAHASKDFPIQWETTLHFRDENFEAIYGGTPDAVCGFEIFDLKWRERDYRAQMAAYALMLLLDQDFDRVRVHVLFAESQKAVVYDFTIEEALAVLTPIHARIFNGEPETPCDYCGWCSRALTCPALNQRAQAVAAGREDWALQQYHTSAIASPIEMGKALRLARFLKKWIAAVEHHAREMAVVRGEQIPGASVKSRQGKQTCADVEEAYRLSGLPPEHFLAACDLRLNGSKSGRKGLIDIFAEVNVKTKASAKRELLKRLEPVLSRFPASQSVVVDSVPDEEEAIDV